MTLPMVFSLPGTALAEMMTRSPGQALCLGEE